MITKACRNALKRLHLEDGNKSRLLDCSHAGLLLSRYLEYPIKDDNYPKARKKLFEAAKVACTHSLELYTLAFERMTTLHKPTVTFNVSTTGRLIIGLGIENVLESGIRLNHTYGVPLIPGSSLKGLASHYCAEVWGMKDDHYQRDAKAWSTLFGDQKSAGSITFEDAWLEPSSLTTVLVDEIVTPHHSEYYSDKILPPSDTDSPTPVSFLAVSGSFRIAIDCEQKDEVGEKWAKLAGNLLKEALSNWGIGGKTSNDYGRMTTLFRV